MVYDIYKVLLILQQFLKLSKIVQNYWKKKNSHAVRFFNSEDVGKNTDRKGRDKNEQSYKACEQENQKY